MNNTIRYIKQQDVYNCGPVALVNLLKWAGYDYYTYKEVKKFREDMGTDLEGTYIGDFDMILRRYFPNVVCKQRPPIKEVDEHLESGGAILIMKRYPREHKMGGHYTIVIGKTEKTHTIINDSRITKRNQRRKNFIRSYFNKRKDITGLYPFVWFVGSENKL